MTNRKIMYKDVNRLEDAIESFSKVVEFCEKEYGNKSPDVLRAKTDLIESNLRYAGHCMDSNESELRAKAKEIIETNRREVLWVLETAMTVLGEKHEDVMMLIEKFSHYRDKGLVYCYEIDDNGEFKTSTVMAKYLDDEHIELLQEIRKDILEDSDNVLDKEPESLVASALAVKYNLFLGKRDFAEKLLDGYCQNLKQMQESLCRDGNTGSWSLQRIVCEEKKLANVCINWLNNRSKARELIFLVINTIAETNIPVEVSMLRELNEFMCGYMRSDEETADGEETINIGKKLIVINKRTADISEIEIDELICVVSRSAFWNEKDVLYEKGKRNLMKCADKIKSIDFITNERYMSLLHDIAWAFAYCYETMEEGAELYHEIMEAYRQKGDVNNRKLQKLKIELAGAYLSNEGSTTTQIEKSATLCKEVVDALDADDEEYYWQRREAMEKLAEAYTKLERYSDLLRIRKKMYEIAKKSFKDSHHIGDLRAVAKAYALCGKREEADKIEIEIKEIADKIMNEEKS